MKREPLGLLQLVTDEPPVQPEVTMGEFLHDTAQPPHPARAAQNRATLDRTGEKAARFCQASSDRLRVVCNGHGAPANFFLDVAP
jgi:hypothetical protein